MTLLAAECAPAAVCRWSNGRKGQPSRSPGDSRFVQTEGFRQRHGPCLRPLLQVTQPRSRITPDKRSRPQTLPGRATLLVAIPDLAVTPPARADDRAVQRPRAGRPDKAPKPSIVASVPSIAARRLEIEQPSEVLLVRLLAERPFGSFSSLCNVPDLAMQGQTCVKPWSTSSGAALRPRRPVAQVGDRRFDAFASTGPSSRSGDQHAAALGRRLPVCGGVEKGAAQASASGVRNSISASSSQCCSSSPGWLSTMPAGSAPRAPAAPRGPRTIGLVARRRLAARGHPRQQRRPRKTGAPAAPPAALVPRPERAVARRLTPAARGLRREEVAKPHRRDPAVISAHASRRGSPTAPRRGAARARRAVRACRSRPASVSRIHSMSASGRASSSTSAIAARSAGADEIVGVLPSGRSAKRRLLPGRAAAAPCRSRG